MGVFESCLPYVLENEGGYSNVPEDAGGPTNFGITQDDLSRWLKRSVSAQDVQHMTLETATDIYYAWYWSPLTLGSINTNQMCICMFDTAVNRGLGVGARYAQTVANQMGAHLAVDGQIGPLSIAALNLLDFKEFIEKYFLLVKSGYDQIVANNPSQQIFYAGWMNRAHKLLTLV